MTTCVACRRDAVIGRSRCAICLERNRVNVAGWRKRNPDAARGRARAYYWKVRERRLAHTQAWRKKNPERLKHYDKSRREIRNEQARKRYAENRQNSWHIKNAERAKAHWIAWQKRNPENHAARQARRRVARSMSIPKWANFDAIKAVYQSARRMTEETGTMYHVDHIVPLQGETVCGLHVPENLRMLPARENARKSNKFIEAVA